ncbi:hypothetical protein, partial [Roseibium sp. RKSG952]|uniref:hypothetical protein n=1 Tax=Roseibium sp. RKSG952 TaxID=2529384 RepID=UPI001AD9408C
MSGQICCDFFRGIMVSRHYNVVECGTQDYHFRGKDDLVEVMSSRLLLNVSKRIQSRKFADVPAAAGRAIEHLRALGVEAKLVGSLARRDFSMDSDVD